VWKCTFRFSAEPKRCTSVTAPVTPVARVRPALLMKWREIVRYTTASTSVSASGSVANKNRNAWGSESTHCLNGRSGNTSSANSAAVSAISPPAAGRAEPALLAAERHQLLSMTLLATHTQESLLQPSALEIRVKLLLHEIWERPVGRGAQLTECGIVLLDESAGER
jgi:hypothetical protein